MIERKNEYTMKALGILVLAGQAFLAGAQPGSAVNFTTLEGKVLFGYQGWFNCPMAGSGSWVHWSRGVPTATNLTVDMYPDLTEFRTQDLCQAGSMTIGGRPAYLYASRTAAVVNAHFRWMKDYGLDGVFVQRFISEAPGKRNSGDIVLKNIMAAAEAQGRTFAIEYDLSGGREATFVQAIQDDWKYMVDNLKVTSHPNYLHHGGKPVVSLWGPGINDGAHIPLNPAALEPFIDWFQAGPVAYRALYMGGTPAGWGTLNGDSYGGAGWEAAYRKMDVIQPWTVGRYSDTNGVKSWGRTRIAPDLAKTRANGQLYLPVIFPGFSWNNLKKNNRPNQIKRLGGKFLWTQAYQARINGASMLKIAMFDEVDEGTAMFKLASLRTQAPDQGYWLTLDADGYKLPSDWYLRLAGEITAMFRGIRMPSPTIPLDPANPPLSVGTRSPEPKAPLRMSRVEEGFLFHPPEAMGELDIHALSGKLVRTLGVQGGQAFWDGRNAAGARLPPGTYLVRAGDGGSRWDSFRILLP